ncbi:metallophosphoesterase [Emticicia agri]|uniref:T9SS type A sorting domain-containing protein n=1 Tax=Emticicia agri TaxID=2492393 RepID=A0A4Q5M5L9_9BACT|nr:metallophosphoesterase [Emticicia agri]RYU97157.1 T9SS type A sorting domain-containing protein [Emticicia agri]
MKKAQKYILTFLLFFVSVLSLQAQNIIRGPYLQQLSNSGVIIRWRTDIATESIVKFYQKDSTQTISVADDKITTEHIVQLSNLSADTRYHYSVGTAAKILAKGKDFYFVTGPPKGSTRPVHIWAMGDFGDESTKIYMETQKGIRESYLKNRPDFTDLWLWLGDNAYCCGTDAEYQTQVFDFYGSGIFGNTAFFPVPGNHEYFASPTGRVDRKIPYFDIISVPTKGEMGGIASNTKAYYSYDYGNVHIIALDSDGFDNGKRVYEPQSPQYQWLKQDLATNKAMWTIVMFHHPPYTKRSHDSDAEPELQYIRENLVPLFDQYKVDLVLTGHSHIYERSYLMKNHTGHSMSFNKDSYVVQKVNGRYDRDLGSSPFINKNDGTIYCTVGSAGRLDWNGSHEVHPSSIYSNISIGGSLLLTVNGNRLDGKWICADNVERDHFSVFKNVNKREDLHVEFGSKIHLNSSWRGSHVWSNGDIKNEEIEYQALKQEKIIVKDSLGFLEDDFFITVTPQPIISTDFNDTVSVCTNKALKVTFNVQHTDLRKWKYSLELSDASGSFNKPLLLSESAQSPMQFTLPDSLAEGNYRVRVRPEVDFFDERPSKSFRLNKPAKGGFIGGKNIPFDTLVPLTLRFTGTPPYTYQLSQLPETTTYDSEVIIKVRPTAPITYTLENLKNVCGNGSISANDAKVSILAPLSVEEESNKVFTIFPNPTYGDLIIENQTEKLIKTQIHLLDLNGKKVLSKTITIDKREVIPLNDVPAGTYVLSLKTSSLKVIRKITKM